MIVKILKKIGAFIYETIQTIVILLSLFTFIYFFAMQPHQIQGASMEPNFYNGEYILTDKISYRFNEPQRGQVIVFKAPNNPRRDYIKRIIGLPGETVSLENNSIYINGRKLTEDYLSEDEFISAGPYLGKANQAVVPEGNYFVLGDNRDHSQDSRSWGAIKRGAIIGKVFFRYWPPKMIGTIEAADYSNL